MISKCFYLPMLEHSTFVSRPGYSPDGGATGFELTFQKCIVKTFCRKVGGNGATTPRLGALT